MLSRLNPQPRRDLAYWRGRSLTFHRSLYGLVEIRVSVAGLTMPPDKDNESWAFPSSFVAVFIEGIAPHEKIKIAAVCTVFVVAWPVARTPALDSRKRAAND